MYIHLHVREVVGEWSSLPPCTCEANTVGQQSSNDYFLQNRVLYVLKNVHIYVCVHVTIYKLSMSFGKLIDE